MCLPMRHRLSLGRTFFVSPKELSGWEIQGHLQGMFKMFNMQFACHVYTLQVSSTLFTSTGPCLCTWVGNCVFIFTVEQTSKHYPLFMVITKVLITVYNLHLFLKC